MKRSIFLIAILTLILAMGCSQEKSQPVQAQSQQQVQQQTVSPAPSSQSFTFRGIKFGVPPESQFPFCTEQSKEPCFKKRVILEDDKKDVREWKEKHGHIVNLPDLGTRASTESQELEMGKPIDKLEMTFDNGKIETMVILMKEKFGEPKSIVSGTDTSMYPVRATYETVTMKWNYQGYDITLLGADPRFRSGEIIILSPELAKEQEAKKGKL